MTTDTDSTTSCKDAEDIPTFDEWKRKVMEVEKEKSKITPMKFCFNMLYSANVSDFIKFDKCKQLFCQH